MQVGSSAFNCKQTSRLEIGFGKIMPPYERCGEIVWFCKRQARAFAFQCIYCEDSRTTTFKDFKLHLDLKHSDLFQDERVELMPLIAHRTWTPRVARDQEAENDPLKTQNIDHIKLEESSSEQDAQATDTECEVCEEEDSLLDYLESDSQSITYTQSTNKAETPSTVTPSSHFWLLEHPIMLAFIDQLEQQRLLWDLGIVSYRSYKRRNEACEEIAKGLNDQFGLHLTKQEIASYVKQLKVVYFKEKIRLERITEQSAHPEWYYERLHFLAKSLRRKRHPKMLGTIDEPLAVPHLNHDQHLKLIELYRQCSANWDMQDLSCRLNQVRQAARNRLLELCRTELAIPIDPTQLQSYIGHLRKTYQEEKVRRLNTEREGRLFSSRSPYYETLGFLENHMAPFKCDMCQELVNSVDGYKIHRAEHDGSLPFVCPTCGKGFTKCGNCTIHMRRHTQDYYLSCEECGKRFATSTDLTVHRRSHTGERPYCCHICGGRYSTVSFLKRHKRRHEQRPVAKCHICGKGFFERTVLRDHIKGHLNVRDKECDVCHKLFTSAKYLKRHKEIHDEHKRYLCKTCGKGFAQNAGLKGHMKSHDKKRIKAEEVQSLSNFSEIKQVNPLIGS
ncbi:zinc finger protein 680-like [Drosophila eugracilis]|uniref:zinc finger protein 680-like n=1 Tax=Drosophila eugracilis TaxID=29029 RepID=UPI0007E7E2C5|nr:zinc finger protein 680-like [Drosophila eugracilis]